jgi:sugar lactone lactonase YvrE
MPALTAILLLVLTALPHASSARSGGITGRSQVGCTGCHPTGSAGLSILGPRQVFEGEMIEYEVRLSGGATGICGMNVSTSVGTLSESSPNLAVQNGEVTHIARISAGPDSCGDSFDLVVPSMISTTTLFAAGYANPGGAAGSQQALTISAPVGPSLLFEAQPERVLLGESTTLHWRTNGLDTCTAFGAWAGPRNAGLGQSESVTLSSATASYGLRCETSDRTVTREASVTVSEINVGMIPPGGFPLGPAFLGRHVGPLVADSADRLVWWEADFGGPPYHSRNFDGFDEGSFFSGQALALDPQERAYVVDPSSVVTRIEVNRALTPVYDTVALGLDIGSFAIAIDSRGDLLVADDATSTVVRVSGATITPVLDYGSGSAIPLDFVSVIIPEPEGSVLVAGQGTATGEILQRANQDGSTETIWPARGVLREADGQLLVWRCQDNAVLRIAADGSDPRILLDASGDGTTPFSCPRAVAVDPAGDVYIGGVDSGFWRVGSDGSVLQLAPARLFDSSEAGRLSVAVDHMANVTMTSDHESFRVSTHTFAVIDSTADGRASLGRPGAMAVDAIGRLYVADEGGDKIFRVLPDGTVEQRFQDGGDGILVTPSAIVVGPDQSLYVAAAGSHNVARFVDQDPLEDVIDSTGNGAPSWSTPSALAIASDGTLFAAGRVSNNVLRRDPDGTTTQIVDSSGDGQGAPLTAPSSLALDSDGTLYVAGMDSDNVLRLDPGGAVSVVIDASDGLNGPAGIALGPGGELYVSSAFGNRVLRVDPDGSIVVLLNESGGPQRVGLTRPGMPSVDELGTLYVPDSARGRLFEIREPSSSSPRIRRVMSPVGDGVEALAGSLHTVPAPGGGAYVSGSDSRNGFRFVPLVIPEPNAGLCALAAWFTLQALRRHSTQD